jgi:hypothetical protein
MISSESADKRLAAAHTKVSETEAAAGAAVKAFTAAQTFLNGIERELGKLAQRNQDLAAARAGKLMAALKMGSSPAFTKKSVSLAADHVAVTDAEHRRDAAQIAVDTLGAEVSAARRAYDDARNALEIVARAILVREAEAVVERIAELEREALQHRVQIEGAVRSGAFGFIRQSGLSDLAKRILRENEALPIGVRNAAEWTASNEEAEAWRRRLAVLLKNNDAPARADRRIKESAYLRPIDNAAAS